MNPRISGMPVLAYSTIALSARHGHVLGPRRALLPRPGREPDQRAARPVRRSYVGHRRCHVVLGHDALVASIYPAARPGTEGWAVRPDADPQAALSGLPLLRRHPPLECIAAIDGARVGSGRTEGGHDAARR